MNVCTRCNKEEGCWSKMFSSHTSDVPSDAVGVSQLDCSGLTLIDPRVKTNEILLCLASATTGDAWRMLSLWQVQKQYPVVQIMLVF